MSKFALTALLKDISLLGLHSQEWRLKYPISLQHLPKISCYAQKRCAVIETLLLQDIILAWIPNFNTVVVLTILHMCFEHIFQEIMPKTLTTKMLHIVIKHVRK